MLIPLNFNKKSAGTVLVELKEAGAIETTDKPYKTYHQGIVIEIEYTAPSSFYKGENIAAQKVKDKLLNQTVYFEEFKDSCQTEVDDKNYAFIALEDIKGLEDGQA